MSSQRSALDTSAFLGWKPQYMGVPGPRLEDDRLLTGRGEYVADIRRPGMVEASFVRSSVAHGRILEVDTTASRGGHGVLAVVTAGDLDGVDPVPHFYEGVAKPVATFPLCRDRVRYVGAPLAVVVAANRYAAEDAAELVVPRIEPLPAVASIDDALDPESPRLYPEWADNKLVEAVGRNPSVDLAFELRTVRGTYTVQRQAAMPLEPRGVVAELHDGRLTVWS